MSFELGDAARLGSTDHLERATDFGEDDFRPRAIGDARDDSDTPQVTRW
jgi:hypothetical protein